METETAKTMEDKINEISAKLDSILALLKSAPAKPSGGRTFSSAECGFSVSGNGTAKGVFRVMTEPRRWSSGKGAFLSCKVDGADDDVWYSIGLTDNVADKVAPGWFPKKGDFIQVAGRYEEKVNGDKTYRSIFAFRIDPDNSVPASRSSVRERDDDSDVPF